MMWRVAALVLALLLALTLPVAIRHLREIPPPRPPALRLTLEPPPGAEFGSGALPLDLAVAPSGREVVFVATTDGGSQLWRQQLDVSRAEPIAGTSGASTPAYAADGSSIWYFSDAGLHRIDLQTGERRRMLDAPVPGGVAVRADGTLLVANGGPIQRIAGGVASAVTTLRAGERGHVFPAWLDEGDSFVYLAMRDDGRRFIHFHDKGEDTELTRADSHAVVISRHLLFVRDATLRAEPLDVERRRVGPRAEALALDVGVSPQGRGAFAAAERLLASGPPARAQYALRWFAETGEALATISEPGDYWQVRLSPDERTVAVTMRDPLLQTLDVFTLPVKGGAPARLTLALAADRDPVWSHDGARLAFRSAQEGQPQIFARPLRAATGEDDPIWRSPLDEVPSDWTRTRLVFHARSAASGFDIWALPDDGTAPRPLAQSGFNEVDGRLSPDGRWLAYASDEGGQFDIYVSAVDSPARRTRISTAGGTRPQWVAGGRGLVYTRGPEVLRVTLTADPTGLRSSTPTRVLTVPGLRDIAAARDGQQFLAIAPIYGATEHRISVVVGWEALLH